MGPGNGAYIFCTPVANGRLWAFYNICENMKRFFFLIAVTLSGCSQTFFYYDYQFKGEGRYIQGVPSFPQEENYCGPAALAGVLNYWGHKVSQEEIAKEVFTTRIKGTITVDMINYAKRAGFRASPYKGSIENIQSEINQVHPLIIYLDTGYKIAPKGHYIVVVG